MVLCQINKIREQLKHDGSHKTIDQYEYRLYESTSNGCGTAEFPMQAEGEKYGLTDCCNAHDMVSDRFPRIWERGHTTFHV